MPMQPMPEPQNTPEAHAHPHAPQAASPSGIGSSATPQAALRRAHATQHYQALPFGSPIATPQSTLNPTNQAPPLPCPDTAMCAMSEPEDFRAAEGDVEMQEAGVEDQAQNPQNPQDRMAGGVHHPALAWTTLSLAGPLLLARPLLVVPLVGPRMATMTRRALPLPLLLLLLQRRTPWTAPGTSSRATLARTC